MERIKDAINKAKSGDNLKSQKAEDAPDVAQTSVDENLNDISYAKTKMVQLDAAHLERNRIVAQEKFDFRSTIFDILRTKVLREMQDKGWKTLAITSPTPACGKTFVAINLAISIARQVDHTVLLADFDLKRSKISEYLGLPAEYSLRDYFEDKVALEDMLINPEIPHLVVLPNKEPDRHSAEILSSKKMKTLVGELKGRYDSRITIFDLPPVLSSDDTIAFLPHVDCVLLIVGNGMASKSDIDNSLRLLKPYNLLGTVLNKAETTWEGYY
ncbi:MAG: CpsD/CapB family tyrosine-protein kinase [Emcibacter sp.]|nr:CpsD/CapB family tyrosine-protein kinase [Emcibacter sp.]